MEGLIYQLLVALRAPLLSGDAVRKSPALGTGSPASLPPTWRLKGQYPLMLISRVAAAGRGCMVMRPARLTYTCCCTAPDLLPLRSATLTAPTPDPPPCSANGATTLIHQ